MVGQLRHRVIEYFCQNTDVIKDKDEPVNYIELYLTGKCQLNCQYCKPTGLKDMSFETAKEAIDQLMQCEPNNLSVQFFGGEPLLNFQMIKKCTHYINHLTHTKNKNINIALSTNGLLLTKRKTEFLIKNNIDVVFSLDGMQNTQKNNRPSNTTNKNKKIYEQLVSNLEYIAQTNLEFFVNMVVGPANLEQLEENVKFLINKGVKNIRISYMMGVFWEREHIKILFRKVSHLYKEYKHTDININACTDEPVLISSGLAINHKGELYIGTTFPLSEKFKSLKSINFYGNIFNYSLRYIKTNKKQQIVRTFSKVSENTKEFHLLANNIFLGINYRKMFQKLERKQKN